MLPTHIGASNFPGDSNGDLHYDIEVTRIAGFILCYSFASRVIPLLPKDKSRTAVASDGGKVAKTLKRQQFGFEALLCAWSDEEEGLLFYTGSSLVQLSHKVSRKELEQCVQSSWLRLRHLSPSIGLDIVYSSAHRNWLLEYSVPHSRAEMDAWAAKTIIFHDTEMPLLAPHVVIDGRGCLNLFSQLLKFLNEALEDPKAASDISTKLEWGSETDRLYPAGVILTGQFNEAWADSMKEAAASPTPSGTIPFLPPAVENPTATRGVVARVVQLDVQQTNALRKLCKSRGRTITQMIDPILVVADNEAILTTAKAHGEQHFNTVVNAYERATHWILDIAVKDERPNYVEHSRNGVTFAVDICPLMLDMAKIREALGFDRTSVSFRRDADKFWNSVVEDYTRTRGQENFEVDGYIGREVERQESVHSNSGKLLRDRAFLASSIGDFDRLGLLSEFTPTAADSAGKKIKVLDVLNRVRPSRPVMFCAYWTFNGKITFYLHASAKYQTETEMDVMAGAFKKWLDTLMAVTPKL
ncbi:hypothetical protein EW146_g3369 [Bondarzewia mesenterica]|uniref:Choline/carnitine acyltransferase domain-containing protein n=1 Tax=Bondarzewia mesenterica TaxID=1095465 RepID=A0A4S4LXQ1_9AGAM|nr:hypothetical protein EW146_g3369 [Bondarzewia mesenterica]